jgi:hypothetical protein
MRSAGVAPAMRRLRGICDTRSTVMDAHVANTAHVAVTVSAISRYPVGGMSRGDAVAAANGYVERACIVVHRATRLIEDRLPWET